MFAQESTAYLYITTLAPCNHRFLPHFHPCVYVCVGVHACESVTILPLCAFFPFLFLLLFAVKQQGSTYPISSVQSLSFTAVFDDVSFGCCCLSGLVLGLLMCRLIFCFVFISDVKFSRCLVPGLHRSTPSRPTVQPFCIIFSPFIIFYGDLS